MKLLSVETLGDMVIFYYLDDDGHVRLSATAKARLREVEVIVS